MDNETQTELHGLRQRAERALAAGRRDTRVVKMLEALAEKSPEGTEPELFAHRQLAELRLEPSPWQAALHLRKLVQADVADDAVHALMGLCQALLGNFRAAVSAYRRAVSLAPRNPWYHHNLGHLLDVGLGDARGAVNHLRIATRIEYEEDEITASLAHCLARLGQLDEARGMAERAVKLGPRNDEHQALLEWVLDGAPRDRSRIDASTGSDRASCASKQVARLLEDRMREAGMSTDDVERAQAIWTDFAGGRHLRVAKPAVFAAAIEYAMAKVDSVEGVTQAKLARRYGVAPGSISTRYGEIRSALTLTPGDPRYAL